MPLEAHNEGQGHLIMEVKVTLVYAKTKRCSQSLLCTSRKYVTSKRKLWFKSVNILAWSADDNDTSDNDDNSVTGIIKSLNKSN